MSDRRSRPSAVRSTDVGARARAASARSPLTPGSEPARADRPRAITAAVLMVLVIGHVLPGLFAGDLLFGSDWNSLAARWANLGWRLWDLVTVLVGAGYVGLLVRARWNTGGSRFRSVIALVLTLVVAGAAVFCILTLGSDFR
ncbi:hypothetical protein ABLG96_06950 [Nakamurella sp. A5-74]|uniref:Succinate dehydrogenase n=1 Tax=Nakamurella sp. A5-74 TaxID=3158264 RepID=A0AAU8DUT1_9ACTN